MRGRLITFEGIDGSGKSTQTKLLGAELAGRGLPVLLTAEPGGSGEFSRRLRELLHERSLARTPATSALLFAADRCEHVSKVIRPALRRGEWVICDRYHESMVAYQGGGEEVSDRDLADLHRLATDSLTPDLTLLLCINRNTKRVRGSSGDYYDNDNRTDFLAQVQVKYLRAAESSPQRIVVLNGELTREKLAEKISALVRDRLG